jgi:hypothetical protein|nr:MAG TPA: hypothetical protein [Bacteriophage sp.]
MHNMIYVVSKRVTSQESEAIKRIFSLAKVSPEFVRVIDVESEDLNITGKSIFLCFNETSGRVTMPLSKERGYPGYTFIKDFTDDEQKVAVCILSEPISHYAMPHCLVEDKAKLWTCVQKIAAKFAEWYPSLANPNQQVATFAPQPAQAETPASVQESAQEAPQIAPKQPKAAEPTQPYVRPENAPTTFSVVQETADGTEVVFGIDEMIDRMIDTMKLSDPGLGKSLKLMDSVVLENQAGQRITVHPGNVIKDPSEGTHISFKDICPLVKLALVSGSDKIRFILRRE